MKKCRFALCCIVALLLWASSARSEEANPDFDKAVAEVRRQADELATVLTARQKAGDELVTESAMSSATRDLTAIKSYVAEGKFAEAQKTVRGMNSYLIVEELRGEIKALTGAVNRAMLERQAVHEDEIAELRSMVSNAVIGTSSDESFAEIKKHIAQVRRKISERRSQDDSDSDSNEEISRIGSFVELWQQILRAEDAGNIQEALSSLSRIERDYRVSSILTTKSIAAKKVSLIRKLIEAAPASEDVVIPVVDEMMQKAKTMEDLVSIVPKLQKVASVTGSDYGGGRPELQALITDIQNLSRISAAMTSLGTAQLMISGIESLRTYSDNSYQHRWKTIISKIREDAVVRVVARACGAEESDIVKRNVPASDMVLALADKAAAARDWQKVTDILDAYRASFAAGRNEPVWLSGEIQGSSQYLLGQRLEKAGEYTSALKAYLAVLESAGKRLPIEEASARLKELRMSHPE